MLAVTTPIHPVHYRRLGRAALVALLSLSLPLSAAQPRHELKVRELAYGESLYHLFQDKNLTAITGLAVAKQRGALKNQALDSDILLAGLYFEYGLVAETEGLYRRLMDEDISEANRNRVWFNLARVNYEQENHAQAESLLEGISAPLPARQEAHKQHMLTNIYIRNQQFDKAFAATAMTDPEQIWHAYSEYNLGVALNSLVGAGQGQPWLDELMADSGDNEEMLSLQGSARLSSGLAALQQQELDKAIRFFSGVRLSGPFANRALLGMGWAWSRKGETEKALSYWKAITEKGQADIATLEAHLAIAHGYQQQAKDAQAIEQYQSAIERYDRQLLEMEGFIESIRRMELIELLTREGDAQQGLAKAPKFEATPYIHTALASKPFQQSIKNYQELLEMQGLLQQWQVNLPSFELMLDERRALFRSKRAQIEQATDTRQLIRLRQQRNQLAERVSRIGDSQDALALANEDEVLQLQRLEQTRDLLARLPDEPEHAGQRARQRVMQGLLYWEISSDFPRRYWGMKHQLTLLDRALGQVESASISVQRASADSEQRFSEFERRITQQNAEVERLLVALSSLIEQQQKSINTQAIEALQQRKQQLRKLNLNALYSLTRLYDEAFKQRNGR